MSTNNHILVILGGIGPMAGVNLHKHIILNTNAKNDQEHLKVIHLSFSSLINDRTNFLLDKIVKNPGTQMADITINLLQFINKLKSPCILGIPVIHFILKNF